jgi:N6-adenosine-specific RNA methylase IME4
MSEALIHFNQARQALQKAKTIDEVEVVIDMAERLLLYLKQSNESLEIQNDAAEIKLRAERRAGEMLDQGAQQGDRKPTAGRPKKWDQPDPIFSPPTLKEIGWTKGRAMRLRHLARIPEDKFEETIRETKQAREELTRAALLRVAKDQQNAERSATLLTLPSPTCTIEDLDKLVERGLTFGTIYADPPWAYGNQATRSATDNHYDTMTLEEIAALPMSELAADECHLHLWTTNAFLHASFHLLEDWGFEFKSLLVWDKDKFGIGNYWRLQTEYLLLGVKGGLTFLDHSQPNIVRSARARHSAKPEAVRRMIEKVSPGPRLEMFARRISNGWTAWGNEIERTMFDADIKEVA